MEFKAPTVPPLPPPSTKLNAEARMTSCDGVSCQKEKGGCVPPPPNLAGRTAPTCSPSHSAFGSVSLDRRPKLLPTSLHTSPSHPPLDDDGLTAVSVYDSLPRLLSLSS